MASQWESINNNNNNNNNNIENNYIECYDKADNTSDGDEDDENYNEIVKNNYGNN